MTIGCIGLDHVILIVLFFNQMEQIIKGKESSDITSPGLLIETTGHWKQNCHEIDRNAAAQNLIDVFEG